MHPLRCGLNYNVYAWLCSCVCIVIACAHWRQKLPKMATNCSRSYSRRKRQQKLPETETNCRQKRQQMLPETATFVAVFGNFCRQCGQAFRLSAFQLEGDGKPV